MDWFLYYLIILIKKCKIPYKILHKALLFSRSQVDCLKNRKIWRAPLTIEFDIFFAEICTHFVLTNVYKSVFGNFLFRLDLFITNPVVKISLELFNSMTGKTSTRRTSWKLQPNSIYRSSHRRCSAKKMVFLETLQNS